MTREEKIELLRSWSRGSDPAPFEKIAGILQQQKLPRVLEHFDFYTLHYLKYGCSSEEKEEFLERIMACNSDSELLGVAMDFDDVHQQAIEKHCKMNGYERQAK